MGKQYIESMIGAGNSLGFDQDVMLANHLQYNHYPPVSLVFMDSAKLAIELVNVGDYNELITMPNGVEISASDIVEQLHLDDFLDCEEC